MDGYLRKQSKGDENSSNVTIEHNLKRNFAPLRAHIALSTNPKEGSETKTMNATQATELSQDSQRQEKSLDDRYGKIGISAVAAAVRHQSDRRSTSETRFTAHDSD